MRTPAALLMVVALTTSACATDGPTPDAAASSTPPTDAQTVDTTNPGSAPDQPSETTPPTTPSEPTPATTVARPTIDGASVNSAPRSPLVAMVSLTLDGAYRLEATATSGDHVVEVPRTTTSDAGDRSIPVVGLRAGQRYDITIRAIGPGNDVVADETLVFDAPPLPEWLPDHDVVVVDAARVSPGYTIIETYPDEDSELSDDGVLVAYDEAGEVVWYWVNSATAAFEQSTDGTLYASYGPFGIRQIDLTGEVLRDWRTDTALAIPDVPAASLDQLPEIEAGDPEPIVVTADWVELRSLHHEGRPLPNGNVLGLSNTVHELTPDQRAALCPGDEQPFNAISDVVVEFTPDGTVLRTWDLWDVIDVDEFPGSTMCAEPSFFQGEINRDWTHANSAIYDPQRNAVIVSSRHTDQVIAFDYLDQEGPQSQLRWILGAGGTVPLDGDPPYHQHAAEVLDDGTMIIYDNGNFRPGTSPAGGANPPYSRAVIYDVDDSSDDPADWTATQLWEHRATLNDGTAVFTAFLGDADPLTNGNVLINHGAIDPVPPIEDDDFHALIIEVVPDGAEGGDIVYQITTDRTQSHFVYRAERIESFYVGDAWEN